MTSTSDDYTQKFTRNRIVHRDTGTQETQDTHDTQEIHETHDTQVSAFSARVFGLKEAVELSLANGIHEKCLWNYARALKAYELTVGKRLSMKAINGEAFALWWASAAPLIGDQDEEPWRATFIQAWHKAKAPLGSNPLEQAIQSTYPLPPNARYSERKQRLISVCQKLQEFAGKKPFYLGLRDASRITGLNNLYAAQAMIGLLVADGMLKIVKQGTAKKRRATEYRMPASTTPQRT